ncbi:MAG: hypothetical protein ACJAXK_003409 [Yoonia sp.]|jgi:hypothetical protein
MALCGIVILVIPGLYFRELFTLSFAIGTGVLMLLAARFLGHTANDLFLRVISLTSMVDMPFGVFSDTIARENLHSDARMLAEEFGGTTQMWGALWLLISIAVIVCCFGLDRSTNLNLS